MRGFEQTSSLLRDRIRGAGEKRGFAITRLLTHWPEIVGEDIARCTRPVKIGYGREGMGATLTLLTTGAAAPMMQLQLPKIREKVNACYGYNAISRVSLTQTAPVGFAEGQANFGAEAPVVKVPDPEIVQKAAQVSGVVRDDGLRAALEALGQNILSRPQRQKGT